MKIQSIVSEEKFFEGKVYRHTHRRMHEGHNAMTIARWPLASGAERIVTLIFDLELDRWPWPWNTLVKHESSITHHWKVKANVKFFADKRTNWWGKNYIPLIYKIREKMHMADVLIFLPHNKRIPLSTLIAALWRNNKRAEFLKMGESPGYLHF